MGRYRAEGFRYLNEEVTGNKAIVKAIAFYKDDEVQLDYQFERGDSGQWKITNYILDDIDTVRNYKKQFTRLFAKKTFDKVVERLRKKIADYQSENRK